MSFLDDLAAFLFPQVALACPGVAALPAESKPTLALFKGGGGTPKIKEKQPKPPAIVIPAAPTPPAPPSPEATQSAADIAAASQEGAARQSAGFGYQASLLRSPMNFGQAASVMSNQANPSTGTSLLGTK